ncbi:MAG: glucosyltransferase domain-containing protein [Oscillospiraceae bacterium]|nr:glucosyltransferase domain-containing protein [Oscillospiraceae bacterium]
MIKETIHIDKERCKLSLRYTCILGIIAHAYAFLHLQLSHDSLSEFYLQDELFGSYTVYEWKIALGRFMNPIFRWLFQDDISRPWLLGLFGLLCIGLASSLTVSLFSMEKKTDLFLVAGIYVTNVTVTACIATYMEDFAVDMLALFLAVLAAFLWKEAQKSGDIKYILPGAGAVILMLGCYQSYLSVTVVLIMVSCVLDLMAGERLRPVFRNGLTGVLMLILGAVGYLLTVKAVCCVTGVHLVKSGYNSLSNAWNRDIHIISELALVYRQAFWVFLSPTHFIKNGQFPALTKDTAALYIISILHAALLLLGLAELMRWLVSNRKNPKEKLLAVVLTGILPLAMNLAFFLSGATHDLMNYAYWLLYLFVLLLLRRSGEEKSGVRKKAAVIMLGVIIFFNVQTANTLYVKKEIVQQSTLSTMTRVLSRIEELDGYQIGETPIAFIGTGTEVQNEVPGTWRVNEITGAATNSAVTYQETYKAYFQNVLQYPICVCSAGEQKLLRESETVKRMPVFPEKGSVQFVGNVIVVKMKND